MRVAKYDANPDNPNGRETLRFRFTAEEVAQLAEQFGENDHRKLRFRLEIENGIAKLIPSTTGGMKVTNSPSGKNYPWEVGFNHRSSPVISTLTAIPTQEAVLRIDGNFAMITLPAPVALKEDKVQRTDFDAHLSSPADVELLRAAIQAANEVSARLNIPLECVQGKVRAFIA